MDRSLWPAGPLRLQVYKAYTCVGMMPATSRTGPQLVSFVLGALGGEVDVQRLRDTHARVVWAFHWRGARLLHGGARPRRQAPGGAPRTRGYVCAGRLTCIAEKRRCEWRFFATVARRARRTATHTTISVRKTTCVQGSRRLRPMRPPARPARQIELRAASSLSQPQPIGRHVLAGRPYRPCSPTGRPASSSWSMSAM